MFTWHFHRSTACVHLCVLSRWVVSSSLWPHGLDCIPPGSSIHGIFQARILQRAAISHSRGSCQPRNQTLISCTQGSSPHLLQPGIEPSSLASPALAGRFFTTVPPGKPTVFRDTGNPIRACILRDTNWVSCSYGIFTQVHLYDSHLFSSFLNYENCIADDCACDICWPVSEACTEGNMGRNLT